MVEYGNAVDQSTGQGGGRGSGGLGGGSDDIGGAAVSLVSDTVDQIAALPP